MAPRAPDPSKEQIEAECRRIRLAWTWEEREAAIAHAPTAAITDEADRVYMDALVMGEELTYSECIAVVNNYSVRMEFDNTLNEERECYDEID